MLQRVITVLTVCLLPFKVLAQGIEFITQSPKQGSMIIGKVSGQGEVFYKQTKLSLDEDGVFVFGVGREAPEKVSVTLKTKTQKISYPIEISPRQWKIERVDGLPPGKVSPKAPEVLKRIAAEGKLVRQARNQNTKLNFFKMNFILPAEGRISGVYGSQRILNGEPKRPHYGLDVANKTGTPVIAPADGVVSLAHNDMFYSGGTLIIDHGQGISSTYIHLNSIDVRLGQAIKQGQTIGTIGATGRATGPHLDWRLNWFQTRLDPQLLLKGY